MTEAWREVARLDELEPRGRRLVKVEGRQIALFRDGERVLACSNRCPHEGYPLIEGTLGSRADGGSPESGGGCVLT